MSLFTELRIPLSPSQIEPVRRWLGHFTRYEEHWAQYPYLQDEHLHITAMCFPFFLGYVDRRDSNPFDIHRLRAQGERAILRQLEGQLSVNTGRYFRKALENLDYVGIGEFLPGLEA